MREELVALAQGCGHQAQHLVEARDMSLGGVTCRWLPDRRLIALSELCGLPAETIDQLVFESGYSSSALRERVYAGPDMAGVLIYTADGDSEGSLGGLVRQDRKSVV